MKKRSREKKGKSEVDLYCYCFMHILYLWCSCEMSDFGTWGSKQDEDFHIILTQNFLLVFFLHLDCPSINFPHILYIVYIVAITTSFLYIRNGSCEWSPQQKQRVKVGKRERWWKSGEEGISSRMEEEGWEVKQIEEARRNSLSSGVFYRLTPCSTTLSVQHPPRMWKLLHSVCVCVCVCVCAPVFLSLCVLDLESEDILSGLCLRVKFLVCLNPLGRQKLIVSFQRAVWGLRLGFRVQVRIKLGLFYKRTSL